jgi:uncharacterized membrane protein
MRLPLVLTAVALAAAAAGSAIAQGGGTGGKSAAEAVPAGSTGRGILVLAPDQRVFKACGGEHEFWVHDVTSGDLDRVYGQLAGGAGKPLFVDVRGVLEAPPPSGPGAGYPRALRIVELRRADAAGAGCRENLRVFELRAWGEDPFWRVDISRGGITWSSYGVPSSLAFPYAPARRGGGEIRYAAVRDGAERHEIELVMKPGRCTDPRTGAVTWLSVEGRLNDRRLTGCAYEGERGQ